MILIPELETVLISPPRTASGGFRRAIASAYPRAMQLYHHMEADGVPFGYDHWRRIGIVRHPVERLWSLYKFLQRFKGHRSKHNDGYIKPLRSAVARWTFDEWLIYNEAVFTQPRAIESGHYEPQYAVLHALPENRKSQRIYLRPDLGTEIFPFDDLPRLAHRLDLQLDPTINKTDGRPVPLLSKEADEYVSKVFAWDFNECIERSGYCG